MKSEILTISDLKSAYKLQAPDGHFFDPDTMLFLRSKLHGANRLDTIIWFITSEQAPHCSRDYSVRRLEDGKINKLSTVSTLAEARQLMQDLIGLELWGRAGKTGGSCGAVDH